MFISPKTAIENGWIKKVDGTPIEGVYIQPNAIDFTIDRVFTSIVTAHHPQVGVVGTEGVFKAVDAVVDGEIKTIKEFPQFIELTPAEDVDPAYHRVPMWTLQPRQSYDIASDFYVEVPEGVAAVLIIRSTFNRGQLFLTSGLYDSGFKGTIGAALHNNGNTIAKVGKGVRVGQIAFVKSESVGIYAGGYNTVEGGDWKETVVESDPVEEAAPVKDMFSLMADFQAAQMNKNV